MVSFVLHRPISWLVALPLISLLSLFLGCQQGPSKAERILNEQELKAIPLPNGITLDTQFCPTYGHRQGITLKERLIQLDAYYKDGKLYDSQGKEIYIFPFFFEREHYTPTSREQEDRWTNGLYEEKRRAQELKKQYTVVELHPPF